MQTFFLQLHTLLQAFPLINRQKNCHVEPAWPAFSPSLLFENPARPEPVFSRPVYIPSRRRSLIPHRNSVAIAAEDEGGGEKAMLLLDRTYNTQRFPWVRKETVFCFFFGMKMLEGIFFSFLRMVISRQHAIVSLLKLLLSQNGG